jgi:S-layer family protein
MKRPISSFLLIFLLTATIAATTVFALNTDGWYQYNGGSETHTFSVRFPVNWKAKIYSDELQGFAPSSVNTDSLFLIKEHEGKSYEQAINSVTSDAVKLVESYDFIFTTTGGDIPAKTATYLNLSLDETFSETFVKRGGLILELTNANVDGQDETIQAIHDSFRFTDGWHQYINLKEGYTFIYPSAFEHTNTGNGVMITDPGQDDLVIFSVVNVDGKIEMAEIDELTNADYYDDYISEMIESFEFFVAEGECSDYKNFPDVCDEHVNVEAINSLLESEVVAGYPDGTFRPDGEINRAELTKMIVATQAEPDPNKYKNCFSDVTDEWFAPYVCYASEQGWVVGYEDEKFKPANNINRAEALKIMLEVLRPDSLEGETKLTDESVLDVDLGAWYSQYFITADNNNLLDKQHIVEEPTGYRYFPGSDISRKEVAETIYRAQSLE